MLLLNNGIRRNFRILENIGNTVQETLEVCCEATYQSMYRSSDSSSLSRTYSCTVVQGQHDMYLRKPDLCGYVYALSTCTQISRPRSAINECLQGPNAQLLCAKTLICMLNILGFINAYITLVSRDSYSAVIYTISYISIISIAGIDSGSWACRLLNKWRH